MEELQEIAPSANFVKAFSSVGSAHMVNPNFETKPTMFICGNQQSARLEVSAILVPYNPNLFFTNAGISPGSFATSTPALLNALIFSSAVPEPLEIIAPACPILFPGGAD